MLLLHGIGRSLEDWGPQYPRLAADHRVIALDLPGSAFSERASERTTLTVLARSALETLDALGEERPAHVIGNSLGGAIAQQLLVLQPHRVASLALVSSAGFGADVAFLLRILSVPVLGRLMTLRTARASAKLAELSNRQVTSANQTPAVNTKAQPQVEVAAYRAQSKRARERVGVWHARACSRSRGVRTTHRNRRDRSATERRVIHLSN